MDSEKLTPSSWKKILNFVVEVIKLVVAAFLGAEGAAII